MNSTTRQYTNTGNVNWSNDELRYPYSQQPSVNPGHSVSGVYGTIEEAGVVAPQYYHTPEPTYHHMSPSSQSNINAYQEYPTQPTQRTHATGPYPSPYHHQQYAQPQYAPASTSSQGSGSPHRSHHHRQQPYGQAPSPDAYAPEQNVVYAQSPPVKVEPYMESPVYPAAQVASFTSPTPAYSPSDYEHNSYRPYACDICGLSFARQHDLKRHRETHKGEKPFPCNGGCGKAFTRKDALKRHQLVKNCGHMPEDI